MNLITELFANEKLALTMAKERYTLAHLLQLLFDTKELEDLEPRPGELLSMRGRVRPELQDHELARVAHFVSLPSTVWNEAMAEVPERWPSRHEERSFTWLEAWYVEDTAVLLPNDGSEDPSLMLFAPNDLPDGSTVLNAVAIWPPYAEVQAVLQPCKPWTKWRDGKPVQRCRNESCTGQCRPGKWYLEENRMVYDCACT